MNESALHIRDDANITMTRAPENRLEDNSLSITASTSLLNDVKSSSSETYQWITAITGCENWELYLWDNT